MTCSRACWATERLHQGTTWRSSSLKQNELTDDLEDLLSLPPGWANDDGKGDDTIKEETFSKASMLLVYFYALMESP